MLNSLVILIAAISGFQSPMQALAESVQKTLQLREHSSVTVENSFGSIRVKGTSLDFILFRAENPGRTRIPVKYMESKGKLYFKIEELNNTDVVLWLPNRWVKDLTLQTASGRIEIQDLEDPDPRLGRKISVRTSSGEVKIQRTTAHRGIQIDRASAGNTERLEVPNAAKVSLIDVQSRSGVVARAGRGTILMNGFAPRKKPILVSQKTRSSSLPGAGFVGVGAGVVR